MSTDRGIGPHKPARGASQPEPRAERTVLTLRDALLAETLSDVVKQHQSILATEQRLVNLHDKLTVLSETLEMRAERYGKIIAGINHAGFDRYTSGLAEQTYATLRELTQAIKQRAQADSLEDRVEDGVQTQASTTTAARAAAIAALPKTQPRRVFDPSPWLGGRWALFSGMSLVVLASALAGIYNF